VHCIDCVREAQAAQKASKPMRQARRASGAPVVTITLIAINVAVFVVGPIIWGKNWAWHLGLFPAYPFEEPWRWVTAGFAHAGILHIGFNMIALFQFGSIVERILGRAKFLVLYAVSLLGSSALVVAIAPHDTYHIGASGAVYGLLAAYLVIAWRAHTPVQQVLVMGGLWLALGFFIPGLSWQGHLGGAIAGGLVSFVLLPRGTARSTIKKWR
jgi:membrane associated rhomboid family serine protease